ncbi:MAG: hypothetical protein LBT14_13740 [Treponema sp.]|jgi:hypothetical protein|nr:hypothetical protein [Treponema sp.]
MMTPLFAQVDSDDTDLKLKLDLPLFDLPYQIDAMNTVGHGFFSSYANPGMSQSLALTKDIYSAMHFGMKRLNDSLTIAPMWKYAIYYGGTVAGLLVFAYVLPFGYPWMQQEYTRSILTRFGVNSFNGAYNYNTVNGMLTGVTDKSLEYFKNEAPHDFIRMYEANIEGYLLLSDSMLCNSFVYNLKDLSNWTALVSTFLTVSKISAPIAAEYGLADVDGDIKKMYENDGGQESRALASDYFINWGYELFHPHEPYAARGVHPSGDGIARYITLSQLTEDEKHYLIKQGFLGYLNLLSPMLYGFRTFSLGHSGFEGNFALHHFLLLLVRIHRLKYS